MGEGKSIPKQHAHGVVAAIVRDAELLSRRDPAWDFHHDDFARGRGRGRRRLWHRLSRHSWVRRWGWVRGGSDRSLLRVLLLLLLRVVLLLLLRRGRVRRLHKEGMLKNVRHTLKGTREEERRKEKKRKKKKTKKKKEKDARTHLRDRGGNHRDVDEDLLAWVGACRAREVEAVAIEVDGEVLPWGHASWDGDVHTLHASGRGSGLRCLLLHDRALHDDGGLLHNDRRRCVSSTHNGSPQEAPTVHAGSVEARAVSEARAVEVWHVICLVVLFVRNAERSASAGKKSDVKKKPKLLKPTNASAPRRTRGPTRSPKPQQKSAPPSTKAKKQTQKEETQHQRGDNIKESAGGEGGEGREGEREGE